MYLLSATKVQWPELSQLSFCSAFDKENLIESPLDLLHYIYNYYHGYAPCLPQSSCPLADFFVICCDCDLWLCVTWPFPWHLSHLLWLCDCHMIFSMLHLSNNLKKKKRKINIDLAVLPSHDIYWIERVYIEVCIWKIW